MAMACSFKKIAPYPPNNSKGRNRPDFPLRVLTNKIKIARFPIGEFYGIKSDEQTHPLILIEQMYFVK